MNRREQEVHVHFAEDIMGIPARIIPVLQSKAPVVLQCGTLIAQLTEPEQAEDAYCALEKALGDDDMAMLACQAEAAYLYYDRFRRRNVDSAILTDTLRCFKRFLAETLVMTGCDKFDRGWWTWRQLSGRLFRIGALEYEMLPETREISLHIPSDAVFTPENVDASLEAARKFFADFFPVYQNAAYVCHSWLISPKLKELLPETSNILAFQRRFSITHVDTENLDFIGWLFCVPEDTPVQMLPEKTTLQKKTKQLLLAGGNIGEAGGILL